MEKLIPVDANKNKVKYIPVTDVNTGNTVVRGVGGDLDAFTPNNGTTSIQSSSLFEQDLPYDPNAVVVVNVPSSTTKKPKRKRTPVSGTDLLNGKDIPAYNKIYAGKGYEANLPWFVWGDKSAEMQRLKRLVETGDTDAAIELAKILKDGNFLTGDREEAINLLNFAAEHGNSKAESVLAIMEAEQYEKEALEKQRIAEERQMAAQLYSAGTSFGLGAFSNDPFAAYTASAHQANIANRGKEQNQLKAADTSDKVGAPSLDSAINNITASTDTDLLQGKNIPAYNRPLSTDTDLLQGRDIPAYNKPTLKSTDTDLLQGRDIPAYNRPAPEGRASSYGILNTPNNDYFPSTLPNFEQFGDTSAFNINPNTATPQNTQNNISVASTQEPSTSVNAPTTAKSRQDLVRDNNFRAVSATPSASYNATPSPSSVASTTARPNVSTAASPNNTSASFDEAINNFISGNIPTNTSNVTSRPLVTRNMKDNDYTPWEIYNTLPANKPKPSADNYPIDKALFNNSQSSYNSAMNQVENTVNVSDATKLQNINDNIASLQQRQASLHNLITNPSVFRAFAASGNIPVEQQAAAMAQIKAQNQEVQQQLMNALQERDALKANISQSTYMTAYGLGSDVVSTTSNILDSPVLLQDTINNFDTSIVGEHTKGLTRALNDVVYQHTSSNPLYYQLYQMESDKSIPNVNTVTEAVNNRDVMNGIIANLNIEGTGGDKSANAESVRDIISTVKNAASTADEVTGVGGKYSNIPVKVATHILLNNITFNDDGTGASFNEDKFMADLKKVNSTLAFGSNDYDSYNAYVRNMNRLANYGTRLNNGIALYKDLLTAYSSAQTALSEMQRMVDAHPNMAPKLHNLVAYTVGLKQQLITVASELNTSTNLLQRIHSNNGKF